MGNDAQVVAAHQQDKQRERERYPDREHFDGAIGLAFVLDEIVERAAKTGDNEHNEQQGKNPHERHRLAKSQSNRIAVSVHLPKLRWGDWTFAPGVWPTLAALFFFVLTLWLGNWQVERADTKRALQARYDTAMQEAPIHVDSALVDRDSVLYRRVEVEGVFDDAHTILLDNRIYNGVAGYHVLTPLVMPGGARAVLVNRGWIATGRSRAQLPSVPAPAGRIKLMGVAADPHSRYFELLQAAPQGQVWQNLDFEQFAALYGASLQPVLLLQTSAMEDGLVRDWPRPDTGVSMHLSYAVQWYSLAATLAVLWLGLNVKRHGGDGK